AGCSPGGNRSTAVVSDVNHVLLKLVKGRRGDDVQRRQNVETGPGRENLVGLGQLNIQGPQFAGRSETQFMRANGNERPGALTASRQQYTDTLVVLLQTACHSVRCVRIAAIGRQEQRYG